MSFLDHFKKLQLETPRIAIINTNCENSEYTNFSTFNKNCYLSFGTHYSEDAYHCEYSVGLTSCMDCSDVEKSELCYELVFSEKCYDCSYGAYLMGCSFCDDCYDLVNCQNCFLSTCLQNASYQILNKKYGKKEYAEKKKELLENHSSGELWKMLEELRQAVPQRTNFQKNCENCIGSDLRNSKNLFSCFSVKNGEDIMYGGTNINQCKDSMDVDNVAANMCQDLYQCIGVTGGYSLICCNCCWFSTNLFYCDSVFNSHDCFGCVGRNHASYEILNQKYSKEEYKKRLEEIIAELKQVGLYGTMWLPSTYPYQDTIAQIHYPQKFAGK